MKINGVNNNIIHNQKNSLKKPQKLSGRIMSVDLKRVPSKVKASALAALFLLPTLGIVKNCSNNEKEPQSVYAPADISKRNEYMEIGERTFYVIQKGDNIEKIARASGISTRRLLAENGLKKSSIIHPNDTLLIPESYTIKNVRNIEDASKATGLSEEFLKDLCRMESVHDTIYKDRNNNKTIGVGHLVRSYELEKYEGRELSNKEIYSLLAQDLINTEMDLKTAVNPESFDKLPLKVRESVIDLVFNKGVAAVTGNKKLFDAINNGDYTTVISNLTQDYSVVVSSDGRTVKKPASGLCKRRLYDIKNAAEIFEGDIPKEILDSARKVYLNGLSYMQIEKNRGEFSQEVYENVLNEYKNLVYEWFDGKIGESNTEKASQENIGSTADTGTYIRVNGQKTKWTQSSLYEDWEKNAKSKKRTVNRPKPEIDEKGNIKALVEVKEPQRKGALSGKTILINPGHGGAMNCEEKDGSLNVNFDPGASNAVMSKKNPNLETNVFIGNGGVALEEWVVNERIAGELSKQLTSEGAKVIFVQGSVYSAMAAIRDIQSKQNVDLLVSLHSNSIKSKRGIYVIGNNRNGTDEEDKKLSDNITNKLNEHNWFKGITHQKEQSLGVLSVSPEESSPVPGVLIETGNLKNEKDVANLNSKNFKTQMVESIFEGIKDYLK